MNNRSPVIVVANANAKPARAASMDEKTAIKATQPMTKLDRTLKREVIHRFTVELYNTTLAVWDRAAMLTSPHPVVRISILVAVSVTMRW